MCNLPFLFTCSVYLCGYITSCIVLSHPLLEFRQHMSIEKQLPNQNPLLKARTSTIGREMFLSILILNLISLKTSSKSRIICFHFNFMLVGWCNLPPAPLTCNTKTWTALGASAHTTTRCPKCRIRVKKE